MSEVKENVDTNTLEVGHVIIWQPFDKSWLPVLSIITDTSETGYHVDTDGSYAEIDSNQIISVIGITPESIKLATDKV